MKKYNILIVDDIFTNRLLLKAVVGKISNSVIEAENGLEAVKILNSENIDIVLMDIEMPVMNGIEATKYIRSKMPFPKNKVLIIAVTAYNICDLLVDNPGFDEILTKPCSFYKILEAIESLKYKILEFD